MVFVFDAVLLSFQLILITFANTLNKTEKKSITIKFTRVVILKCELQKIDHVIRKRSCHDIKKGCHAIRVKCVGGHGIQQERKIL